MTPEEIAALKSFGQNMNAGYGPQFYQQFWPVDSAILNSPQSIYGNSPTITGNGTLTPNAMPKTGSFATISGYGAPTRSPVTPVAQSATLPGSSAPSSLGPAKLSAPAATGLAPKAAYLTKPMSEWTGDDFAAYKADNAPSNAPGYFNMAMQGINTAAQVGMGIASLVQAQDAFNLQKRVTETNLARQLKSYNDAVSDRVHGSVSAQFYARNKDAIENEIKNKQQT